MAGQRQPTALVQAKGRKHFTKAELEARLRQEPKCQFTTIEAPYYLPEDLHEDFYDIAYKLVDLGVMTELDEDTLASYLLSRELWLAATAKLMGRRGSTSETAEKLLKFQNTYFKQCHTAASALGLTISSRCKLVVPDIGTDTKPTNKFAKFQQGA